MEAGLLSPSKEIFNDIKFRNQYMFRRNSLKGLLRAASTQWNSSKPYETRNTIPWPTSSVTIGNSLPQPGNLHISTSRHNTDH